MPKACPACQHEGTFAACGPGVERLAEEAATLFPNARRMIITSDTVGGPKKATELIRMVTEREVDLIIGTQIIAKGHHFPHLTLVGVVDADLGLSGGDLRAAERTYQLLHQVAGRAGRAERPGRVLVQSYDPDRAVIHVRKPTLKIFTPANPNGAAVLVLPGGGYQRVVLDKEGDETALRRLLLILIISAMALFMAYKAWR